MSGLPILLDDLGQPLGHGGHQLLQVVTVAQLQGQQFLLTLAKAKILFKVALDILSWSLMVLFGTLAFQSTIAAFLSPWLKVFCSLM